MLEKVIGKKNLLVNVIFVLVGVVVYFSAEPYFLYVATSWLIFGILGLSLDLVWGKCGILSLGQTVFYGIGGYVGAVFAINYSPVIGNTFVMTLPISIFVGSICALLIGYIIFYSRMGSLQVTILTYTSALVVWTLSISFSIDIGDAVIGGDNGMSNIPLMVLDFGSDAEPLGEQGMFLSVLFISMVSLLFSQMLMKSPFGKVIECIRLDIQKTELIGNDVRKYQSILFIISGGIAGLAGGLFALWGNYLNPSVFSVADALLVPIYVLTGGLGTLVGPFLGAIAVGGLSFYFGGISGSQTTLIIGIILILMVLFFDKGLVGAIKYLYSQVGRRKEMDDDKSTLEINVKNYKPLKEILSESFCTQKVYKSFGGVIPVNKIDKLYKKGQVSCIIGPNGAGKSSYLRVCVGVYKPESGDIFLGNKNITNWQLFENVKAGLGIKMQKPQIFKTFSVKENIWIAAYSKHKDSHKADKITNNVLNILGGEKQGERLASSLSHGEQQWLDIAMVLSLWPSVVFFDEPAAGMTQKERTELSALMNYLCKSRIVILVEHDMDFVRSLNAHVTVLHQGKIFANGTIDELHEDERILDIYLGRNKNVEVGKNA